MRQWRVLRVSAVNALGGHECPSLFPGVWTSCKRGSSLWEGSGGRIRLSFGDEAVNLVVNTGRPVAQVAKENGLVEQTLGGSRLTVIRWER